MSVRPENFLRFQQTKISNLTQFLTFRPIQYFLGKLKDFQTKFNQNTIQYQLSNQKFNQNSVCIRIQFQISIIVRLVQLTAFSEDVVRVQTVLS